MSKDIEAKNKQLTEQAAKIFGVDPKDVFIRAVPRERDVQEAGATVVQRELYYTEIACEVRIPGPGLLKERKAAEKAAADAKKNEAKNAKKTKGA